MERKSLNGSIRLCGKSDTGLYKRNFNIIKTVASGASVICYEATYEHGTKGILKEFYPKNATFLKRDSEGQLVCDDADFKSAIDFRNDEKAYTEPYEMLRRAKIDSKNSDLATFIPPFEIYRGCDENMNIIGTTYIWTPEPKLESFSDICDDIHKNPDENPEHKLVLILSAIESLTDCICALHSASMLHRDIKPSNFGFIKRANKTLTETLSMFDIDSVCSVYNIPDTTIGTDGYIEPETGYELPSCQSDIFAIGATLYYAVVNSKDTKANGYLYNPERYGELASDIDNSLLIKASEANSHPRLRNAIVTILRKSLAARGERYKNCEELKEDIETALYFALPSDVAQNIRHGEKWVLTKAAKSLDKKEGKNSFLALLCHLYTQPLYQTLPPDADSLNVMIFGFGNYGQKFLDICLQAGQIKGSSLNVTVFSDTMTDRDIYLNERPALPDFFSIDNKSPGNGSYGSIVFRKTELYRDSRRKNKEIMQDIICDYQEKEGKTLHYIFIALGDDILNMTAAEACHDAVEVLEIPCPVNFSRESKKLTKKLPDGLNPVYVCEDARKSDIFPALERMAFNVHLVWQKNLNISLADTKKEFRDPYNYNSCLGYVLALKYKLHSINIDMDNLDYVECAKKFCAFLSDKTNTQARDILTWLEHRRWVTEKLCLGWRAISDINDCAVGITKDERRKRHLCIAKSRPDCILAKEFCKNGSFEKWDTATKEELNRLDPLDRISVKLHRMYKRRAEEATKKNILNGNIVSEIRLLIDGNKEATVAFQEWYTCLKDIRGGDRKKISLYKNLKNAFSDSLSSLTPENRLSVREQIKALDTQFLPILASLEYRDFKQDDIALVDSIPFILTYSESLYLVIPYKTGDNTDEFSNLAAATVLNPARIIYLAYVKNSTDLDEIVKNLSYMAEYMKKKNLRAGIDFVFVQPTASGDFIDDAVISQIKAEGMGRIRQIKVIATEKKSEIKDKVLEYLNTRKKGKHIFAAEYKPSGITDILETSGFFDSFDCYEFDMGRIRFKSLSGCDALEYVKKTPYVSINDMISFEKSSSESSNQPEFFNDYKDLWHMYRQRNMTLSWKLMCEQLAAYSDNSDILVKFKKLTKNAKKADTEVLRYIIPYNCNDVTRKILNFLRTYEIAEPGSSIKSHTSRSCEVIIKDRCGYKNLYDRLFANPYTLMIPEAIKLHLDTKAHEVHIRFDNLIVTDWKPSGNRAAEICDLIKFLEGKGYLTNLTDRSGSFSFTYATSDIKELMTTAGKLLEVYVYHKIKETSGFDDVVSSFEINMENTEVTSEFDAIVTKGFRTLFIECKATSGIKQEYYYKIAELARKYGINATAVLIADTQEQHFHDTTPVNIMQRQRGDMLGVITVYKPEEINNIGETLLKIAAGSYQNN